MHSKDGVGPWNIKALSCGAVHTQDDPLDKWESRKTGHT